MSLKKIAFNAAVFASVVAAATVISRPVLAGSVVTNDGFDVTIEAPGQEVSSLLTNPNAYGATNVYEANFDNFNYGFKSGTTSNPAYTLANIGSINSGFIQNANQYGGAGGTGKYFDVDPNTSGAGAADNQSVLKLNNPESYFGLWWSAGDPINQMQFYSTINGVETLVDTETTAQIVSYLQTQPGTSAYYSNPSGQFAGQDGGEPFAFLNYFAPKGVTFDEIVFSNPGGTGFESDNWTVASSYTSTSGTALVPESSTTVGLLLIAGLGLLSQRKRVFGKI
jgi:hypothetical protein